jgi:hypothetical protein
MAVRRRSWRGIVVIGALGLTAVSPAGAVEAELSRYYDAARDICRTGVTPAITAAYEEARRALDRARPTGGLQSGNFAGLKAPTELWLDCFQSPGDGKM